MIAPLCPTITQLSAEGLSLCTRTSVQLQPNMRTQQKLCLILKRNNIPSRVVRVIDEFSVGDRCYWQHRMDQVLSEIDRNNEAVLLIWHQYSKIRFRVPTKCKWRQILFWIRWVLESPASRIIQWAFKNSLCERHTVVGRGRMWVFGKPNEGLHGAVYDKEWEQPNSRHHWKDGGEGLLFLRTFVLKNTVKHVSGHTLSRLEKYRQRRRRLVC